ncbi:hypothetical protein COLO4_00490 [Corchorus olitorius]|uniref:Uncharacterized protein n=1 Tax=Corchorus olitorius TaxID=93759 RepID=A0A1R3L3U0_9ROSI|nr:hypothetical protein COLO4_00490 [Corchorus olitorius]
MAGNAVASTAAATAVAAAELKAEGVKWAKRVCMSGPAVCLEFNGAACQKKGGGGGVRKVNGWVLRFWRPGAGNELPDQMQLAVEEMIGAGDDDHGQLLWARPVEHVDERHGVVLFAVDDDGVGRHRRDVPARGGGAHQRQALGGCAGFVQAARHLRDDKAAERETAQRQRQRSHIGGPFGLCPHPVEHGQHVVLLADAVVVRAFGLAHTAKIQTHRRIAEADEGACQRLRDLVVLGAAEQRMRMADQRQAARAVDHQPFNGFAFDQMALDDFVDVFLVDEGVPDGLGVDHHDRTEFAAVEAAGLVDAHAAFTVDAEFLAALLGVFLHGLGAKVGAAARAVLAFVQAKENVVLVVAAHGRTEKAGRAA